MPSLQRKDYFHFQEIHARMESAVQEMRRQMGHLCTYDFIYYGLTHDGGSDYDAIGVWRIWDTGTCWCSHDPCFCFDDTFVCDACS